MSNIQMVQETQDIKYAYRFVGGISDHMLYVPEEQWIECPTSQSKPKETDFDWVFDKPNLNVVHGAKLQYVGAFTGKFYNKINNKINNK